MDGRAPDRAGFDRQLVRVLAGQTRPGRIMSALAIPMVLAVLAGELNRWALVLWGTCMALDALADVMLMQARTRRVANGEQDGGWARRATVHYFSFGVAWGSLPLFALIDERTNAMWLSSLIVLAILTVYIVTTAASRLMFALGAAPLMGQLAVAIALSDVAPVRLALLAATYGAIAVLVHDALHRALIESMRSKDGAERLTEQLHEFLAARDPATQLLNRRSFIGQLDEALGTFPSRKITVEVGNVRRLTAINELYGEEFGDALIAHVGSLLQAIPPHRGFAGRLSGDEFVVATYGDSGSSPILALAGEAFTWSGATTTLDFSSAAIDASAIKMAGERGEHVVSQAVHALRADSAGRAIGRAAPSGASASSRRDLIHDLRDGLSQAGVRAWFQPIVDTSSRQVVAWEALIRWQHPEHGLLAPDQLLPLIDMSGMSSMLVELVVAESLDFLAHLDAAGAADHAVHVNVNATDLRNRATPDTVQGALQDSRISAQRLVLELTEREILHMDPTVRTTLAHLDAAGVALAVDDFGTGYSSLSHLLDFPADHLKIDRRFITGLPDDTEALALVRGVVSMARGMGLISVAEGVETEAAAHAVQSVGCDRFQGYLVSPALPPDDALAWALERTATRADQSVTRTGDRDRVIRTV